jgi:heat-inducible transcriptional repressor
MRRQSALTDRNVAILHTIVQTYIETGEPVASRTIARRLKVDLSSASIRNIMADLYEEGYLSQPHTSAGRVPTEKAYQSYVKTLVARRILSAELHRLRSELNEVESMRSRVERSSHILMEMTRGFCIAAAIPTAGQMLDQVDLLALSDRRVLMVVVTRDQMVHNRVVAPLEKITQDELYSIRNYLNYNFRGWMLSDVHRELELRLEQESAAYDSVLNKLNVLYEKGLLDIAGSP